MATKVEFEEWMEIAEKMLMHVADLQIDDLADWPWALAWEHGDRPMQAVKECLEDEGFFDAR